MTTFGGVVPVSFDGTSLQNFASGIWLDLVVGLVETPNVRGSDTTIPASAGTLEGNRVNDYLPLELRGSVRAAAALTDPAAMRASYFANLQTVRTLFASNRSRANLVATIPGGITKTISARPLNIVFAEIIPGEYAELSISLAGDDDWTVS